jgi:putative SOS response-associated peptidase YedK
MSFDEMKKAASMGAKLELCAMNVLMGPEAHLAWMRSEIAKLRPFPANLMRMWPISTRVNKPEMTTHQLSSRLSCSPACRT